ncbi:MAG: hypothetical protein JW768_01430 [Chitinispirillaceae bacterium]|nr:hypothetical protein [Chitinispirillaceae bacterium]
MPNLQVNSNLSATPQPVTDGVPTNSVLSLATDKAGIGTTSPSEKLELLLGKELINRGHLIIQGEAAPASKLTGTAASGGSIALGRYSYRVTFITGAGDETNGGPVSDEIDLTGSNQTIDLTGIPTGTSGIVTARKVYRKCHRTELPDTCTHHDWQNDKRKIDSDAHGLSAGNIVEIPGGYLGNDHCAVASATADQFDLSEDALQEMSGVTGYRNYDIEGISSYQLIITLNDNTTTAATDDGTTSPSTECPSSNMTYSIGVGTTSPAGIFDVAGSDSSKKILTLKENTTYGNECFEVQSIGGTITVIPREKTSAGITDAIRYLQNIGKGGTVFLPGGDYTIDSTVYIGDDGDQYHTPGNGIQLIGAGALKTILKITKTTEIAAIKIANTFSVNVVIKDLTITIDGSVSGQQDGVHTAIESMTGIGIIIENVVINSGWDNDVQYRFQYGIKQGGWGPNLFQFCNINHATKAGILLSAANATNIFACQVGVGDFNALSEDVYGIKVESGVASVISGCTFHGGRSYDADGKTIGIYLGPNTQQTVVMNNYFEAPDIGVKIESKGNTVIGNWYSVRDSFIDMVSGFDEGNTILPNRNQNTGRTDPMMCQLEMANPDALGPESLEDGGFLEDEEESPWDCGDGFSIENEKAVYIHNESVYTRKLSQSVSNMSVKGVGNRWYKFEYTVSESNFDPADPDYEMGACLINTFPLEETPQLNLTDGTHCLFFKSNADPGKFEIWVSSSKTASTFKLDNLSLREVQGGDVAAHGLFTGGGTSGIKVLSNGKTGFGGTENPGEMVTVRPGAFDSVQYFDGSDYTDRTTEAKTGGTAYTVLADTDEAFYVGSYHKFSKIFFDIETAGVGLTLSAEYYHYNTTTSSWEWTGVSIADGTVGLSQDGTIVFTPPDDWARYGDDDLTQIYWIRLKMSTLTTAPTAYLTLPGDPDDSDRLGVYAKAGDTTPALLVEKGGNVGLGTLSPAAKLSVVAGGSPDFTNGIGQFLNTGMTNWNDYNFLLVGKSVESSGNSAVFGFRWDSTLENQGAFISVRGDDINSIFVRKGGNVGLGLVGPASKLSVAGNASVGANYAGTPAPDNGMIVEGNVGIGTTSPQTTLHTKGGSGTGDGTEHTGLILQGTSYGEDAGSQLQFDIGDGSDGAGYGAAIAAVDEGGYDTRLEFRTKNSEGHSDTLCSASDTKMCIDADGAVGIGTTSPAAGTKLEVNGNIKASGEINAGGNASSGVKWKVFTGTLSGTSDPQISHGLTASKIIGITGNIKNPGSAVYNCFDNRSDSNEGNSFYVWFDETYIHVYDIGSNVSGGNYKLVVMYQD